jgi:hypothetical protein
VHDEHGVGDHQRDGESYEKKEDEVEVIFVQRATSGSGFEFQVSSFRFKDPTIQELIISLRNFAEYAAYQRAAFAYFALNAFTAFTGVAVPFSVLRSNLPITDH